MQLIFLVHCGTLDIIQDAKAFILPENLGNKASVKLFTPSQNPTTG